MFQDEIMLKELTQLLAYNVKVDFDKTVCQLISVQNTGTVILSDVKNNKILTTKLDNIKLYLYPLSSLSESQREKLQDIVKGQRFSKNGYFNVDRIWVEEMANIIDLFHKWHIDYRGMIDQGKAIDATNKIVYYDE